jgi:hypothetical protein
MNEAAWLAVTLCVQSHILSGFVYLQSDERLLDLLNGMPVKRLESRGKFLALSDVTVHQGDAVGEKLSSAYINKAAIYMAATWNSDLGRGLGARSGQKPYPFVEKMPIPVRLWISEFLLIGSMYCASGQRAWHVLEEEQMFLPLTNVEVRPLADGIWSDVPFVAVNREQVLSLQEEETPLLQVTHGKPEPPA